MLLTREMRIIMGFFSKLKELSNLRGTIESLEKEEKEINEKLLILSEQLDNKEKTISEIRSSLEAENEAKQKAILDAAEKDADKIKYDANLELSSLLSSITTFKSENTDLEKENTSLHREVNRYTNQARKFKAEIVGIKNFFNDYRFILEQSFGIDDAKQIDEALAKIEQYTSDDSIINTIIQLPLHSDNSKELRKYATATKNEIKALLESYQERYTSKANKTIYQLMIIGLQAEMQLLLAKLTYQNLNETKKNVKEILAKYITIASEGNQSIKPTLLRFVSDIEPLYMELVDTEYRYYVKRQQEKEEQQAIKEQMRIEAEEKKALQAEKKKLEKEESKYLTEMDRNKELLKSETDSDKIAQLEANLKKLQEQLENVAEKKEEIITLSTGKAGYVYVISNLGSFGENVFKIGMTRRLEPQQRVDELGSASVPFKFDVHAMIFSDDAVSLENDLHKQLAKSRINKVNPRKEFFKSDVNSLENLVEEIDPTADFTKTMYAEEYQQTKAIEESLEDSLKVTAGVS